MRRNSKVSYFMAAGTQVYTNEGWLPIEKLSKEHQIFDGEQFIICNGSALVGKAVCMDFLGALVSPDLIVSTDKGRMPVKNIVHPTAIMRVLHPRTETLPSNTAPNKQFIYQTVYAVLPALGLNNFIILSDFGALYVSGTATLGRIK